MGLMTLLVDPRLSKLHFRSHLVSVLLIVHQLGTHHLFAVHCHLLLMIEMGRMTIQKDLPAIDVARVVTKIIQTETGREIGIGIETGRGTGTGIETGAEIEIGTGIELEKGTETGIEKGIEIGGMIMIGGPEKAAEGIMIGAAVIVAGITEKVVLVEAGAGAGAGAAVRVSKLAVYLLITIQVHIGMEAKKKHLHLAIWPS